MHGYLDTTDIQNLHEWDYTAFTDKDLANESTTTSKPKSLNHKHTFPTHSVAETISKKEITTLPKQKNLAEKTIILPKEKQEKNKKKGKIIAVVPAHNEEETIAQTIKALLDQTRKIDSIIIMADNCTDKTVKIAKNMPGVIVQETQNNKQRKVGALNQAWELFGENFEYWLGVDADTILEKDAVKQLEEELKSTKDAAGIMARYSFSQEKSKGKGLMSSMLVFCQRLEFAGWVDDLLHNKRHTYVLGGQATLFRTSSLKKVATLANRKAPWDANVKVEDMEITWQFGHLGKKTLVSATARAWADPMIDVKSLWAQRRKWDTGMAEILQTEGRNEVTKYPWKLQYKSLLDLTIRLGFLLLLGTALLLKAFTWYWIWAFPPVFAMLLNLRVAWVMPKRRKRDLVYAATLLLPEAYLWFRLAIFSVSWISVLRKKEYDGWGKQYAAENKNSEALQKKGN